MRDLIRRNTTRQLIVSKPDIKQTSDKAIVTVYIFDREKAMYVRKLFFIKNSLNKSTISNNITVNKRQSNIDNLISNLDNNNILSLNDTDQLDLNNLFAENKDRFTLQNKHLSLIRLKKKWLKRIRKYNPKKGLKIRQKRLFLRKLSYRYRINNKIVTRILYKSLLNKKSILNNLFMLKFLKWIMSYFNITVSYIKANKSFTILNVNNKLRDISLKDNVLLLSNNIDNRRKVYNLKGFFKLYRIPKLASLLQIRLINKILLTQIKMMMKYYVSIDSTMRINTGIRKLFDMYRNKYLIRHAMFYLRKQKLTLSYLVKLYNNKLKYNNLIYGFKSLLNNVYSKNIKLNLVNLKYLHLNSDIFTKAVSIKLRKK